VTVKDSQIQGNRKKTGGGQLSISNEVASVEISGNYLSTGKCERFEARKLTSRCDFHFGFFSTFSSFFVLSPS
jgi:hypothetical protein